MKGTLAETGYRPDVEWYLRYANEPRLKLIGPVPDHASFEYENVRPNDTGGGFLLSTNMYPWIKYVYIENPEFSPIRGGALGGHFSMKDGSILKSKCGWSSRAGVVNREFADIVGDEIIDVTVGNYFGFAVAQNSAQLLLEEFDNPFYLVRKIQFGDEPYWIPSISRNEVVKRNG